VALLDGSGATVIGSAIARNGRAGVFVEGSGSAVSLAGTLVLLTAGAGAPGQAGEHGHGAASWCGSHLDVLSSVLRDNTGAGAFFDNATGKVTQSALYGNGWQLVLQQAQVEWEESANQMSEALLPFPDQPLVAPCGTIEEIPAASATVQ
jgi:hypothetical protein